MRYLYLVIFFSLSLLSPAQTVLNAYARITSVTGSSVLALSNVNISNHTFTVGGSVIVMQMQDNVIGTNTTNAATFGNLSTIANAGRYEIRTIAAVTPTSGTPTSVTLSAALSNTYNINANSSVQLISFRDMGTNFTTSSNITGLAWNGNIGGVVAFYVTNTLTLNHQVLADGLGFRGGAVSANASGDYSCVNTTYITSVTTIGYKGEGIYVPTVSTYLNGRGKILNGGGGGAENNAGGGGGGNYTSGGDGGLGYPCTTGNSGRGLGGISLSTYISASRIFLGGGGGGGQANNSLSTPGGNGGGIILIKANTIATSGSCGSSILISANGVSAGNSGNDGAGGGGAGGSIVINATSFSMNPSCPLTVRANAGNGGNVGDAAAHGGGAGGGQGAVIYSSTQPTVNVTTQTNNGSPGADNSGGTTNATGGGGTNGGGIIASSTGPLPVELVEFKAQPQETRVLLQWATASETGNAYFIVERSAGDAEFMALPGKITGAGYSSTYNSYSHYDNSPLDGISYYRLKQTDLNGDYKYSPVISVDFSGNPDFSFFPNPVKAGEPVSFRFDKPVTARELSLTICDITGNQLYSEKIAADEGSKNLVTLKSLNLQEGLYLLKVQSGSLTRTKKLVVH